MRVFLSYAGEDRPVAERVAHSIRARGHHVFFDKDDLPPGASFEDKIEAAVGRSDVFVFLISSHSVEPGSFTLTELDMAERKWKIPAGRVLPVMIEPTAFDRIPAYAKAVTVFEPRGDVAAETAIKVQQMRGFPWRRVGYAAASLVLMGIGAIGLSRYVLPRPQLQVEAQTPWSWERGYFGSPGRYKIDYTLKNGGNGIARLISARLRVEPRGALELVSGLDDYASTSPVVVGPAQEREASFLVSPKATDLSNVKWSVCLTDETQTETCSAEAAWSTRYDFSPATRFEIPKAISENAIAVVRYADHFVLASRGPGMVHEISASGEILSSREIEGEPSALYADKSGVFVGTRGPDAIVRLSGEKLSSMQRTLLAFPASIKGVFGDAVSSTPASIARGGNRLWIVTRGGAAGAGLMHVAIDLTDPRIPPYYDKISSATQSMVLASNGSEVWGSVTNVTPASLYKLTPDQLKTYDGHDYDIASCASGILVRASDLLVPNCKGWVESVREVSGKLQIATTVGNLLGYKMNAGTWTTVQMRPTTEDAIAFLVQIERTAGGGVTRSIVSRPKPLKGLAMPLDLANISIVDLAAQDSAFIVIIDDGKGKRQTLALKYE